MFNYSQKSLYLYTTLIAITIFVVIEFGLTLYMNKAINITDNSIGYRVEIKALDNTNELIDEKPKIDKNIWELEIPKHELIGPIKEGTGTEILKDHIGHFEGTPKLSGNVCLASHNRGSVTGDYFSCLENIEIGELIIYRVNGEEKEYKVILSTIIDETDLSYIQNTQDNRLTLITCIKNKPQQRRCVQAINI